MIAYLAIFVVVRLMTLLPLRLALAFGRCAGWFAFTILRLRRRVVLENLAHVFGSERSPAELKAIGGQAYQQCAMTFVEVLRASGGKGGIENVSYDDLSELRAIKESGAPVVVVQPHLGNFDLVAYGFAMQGFPIHTVMKKIRNPHLNAFMKGAREKFAITVHVKQKSSYRELKTVLGDGGWLGVLPDQRPRSNKGVEVELLGQPARIFPGPALLHLETGARVVVGWDRRLDDPTKHHGSLRALPPYTPTGDRAVDVQAIMQNVADLFGEAIRAAPEQYFWFHRLWGKTLGERREVSLRPAPGEVAQSSLTGAAAESASRRTAPEESVSSSDQAGPQG